MQYFPRLARQISTKVGSIHHFPPPPAIEALPLSFATRVGDLLFISGIPGFDDNGELPDGFEAQFGNVVTNIKRVLDDARSEYADRDRRRGGAEDVKS